jgi:hypothetical protein
MSREAMKQALEALEEINKLSIGENAICLPAEIDGAMDALRERLAQPEMEPCAGRNCGSTNPNLHSAECFEDHEKATGMNQWVGLTADEIWKCNKSKSGSAVEFHICSAHQNVLDFAEAIEAKLKEKNT